MTVVAMAIPTVGASIRVELARSQVTAAINPSDEMTTPSSIELVVGEARSLGMSG